MTYLWQPKPGQSRSPFLRSKKGARHKASRAQTRNSHPRIPCRRIFFPFLILPFDRKTHKLSHQERPMVNVRWQSTQQGHLTIMHYVASCPAKSSEAGHPCHLSADNVSRKHIMDGFRPEDRKYCCAHLAISFVNSNKKVKKVVQ